jgi:hypothetical protein
MYFLCAIILFSGCTVNEQVRLDIDKFIRDQASYIDENVVSRYDIYRGKKIELSAPFSYFGTKGFWTWHIILQKGENTLRCYTHYYRIKPTNEAINLLKRAESKKQSIKILGFLYQDGLDIKEIYHEGISVRPDFFLYRR